MAEEKKDVKAPAMASTTVSGLSNDSKVWAALCYVFPILMFIIVYLTDKKKDKFVFFHAWQSLLAGLAGWVISMVLAVVTFGIGSLCFPLYWLVLLYFAYQAYMGQKFVLPVIGEFAEKQMSG
ncbi:hypothetical protein L0Y65_03165 [Candidatus Micrarchaeota archaeon]|nr:hypothetical protein [Candidatus Micrarchaeota archaeon]